jgi:hypothetical protein
LLVMRFFGSGFLIASQLQGGRVMAEEIEQAGEAGSESPKELTAAQEKLPLPCPYCDRTFADQRGLGPHLRFHKPKSPKVTKVARVTRVSGEEPASDVIEQAVNKALENQLSQLIPELKKGIEDNLSTTLVESIKLLHEKIDTNVNELAQKVEAELLARFPAAGAGNLPAVQGGNGMGGMSPILQALLARFMAPSGSSDGGGNFLQQAANIGQAIGAMLQPIQNIQAAAFSNSLKLMDIAQKWGSATPVEKEKLLGEVASVAGAPPPATTPPAPPPPAIDKAPGALGPGS